MPIPLNKRERVNTGGTAIRFLTLLAIAIGAFVIHKMTQAGFDFGQFFSSTFTDLFN